MAAVVCTFEPIRRTPHPPAPSGQASQACQNRRPSPRTRRDVQGLSCNDAVLRIHYLLAMVSAPLPTCKSPSSALVSIQARSNTPTLRHKQDREQEVKDAGRATPPQHGRCYNFDNNEYRPIEEPAAKWSPDSRESPTDSATYTERDKD